MKQILLFFCFCLFFITLFAQNTPRVEQLGGNRRVETYPFYIGGDSVRYTIANTHDTMLTELFWLGGQISSKAWGKDSVYYYWKFGQLAAKRYFSMLENKENVHDSLCYYAQNGQMYGERIADEKGSKTIAYDKNQRITRQMNYAILSKEGYYNTIFRDNIKRKAMRLELVYSGNDSFRVLNDTTFYSNNRIKTIEHSSFRITKVFEYNTWDDNKMFHRREYYDMDGKLLYSLTPDNARLFSFKDNISCYYGFKNRRGDTVIAPRYDNVERVSQSLWVCEEGTNKILMRLDGTILSSQKMQAIKRIMETSYYDDSPRYSDEESFFLNRADYKNPTFFAFQSNNKYGVIDSSGKIILPPQYFEIDMYNAKTKQFIFHQRKGYITIKSGAIDAKTGEIIPNDRFPILNSAGQTEYFIFSDTIQKEPKPTLSGLVNKTGDVLLPALYSEIKNTSSHLFWVNEGTIGYNDYGQPDYSKITIGLFDAQNKRWILNPVYRFTNRGSYHTDKVLYDIQKKQCGLVDTTGKWLLPTAFDTIVNIGTNEYVLAQNGQYFIYNTSLKKTVSQIYQFLAPLNIYNQVPSGASFYYESDFSHNYENPKPYFIVKQDGKWGLIDGYEKPIMPFVYDYAGSTTINDNLFCFVKGNEALVFNENQYPKQFSKKQLAHTGTGNELIRFDTYEDASVVFFINRESQVTIPPQYKIVSEHKIQDKDTKRITTSFVAVNKSGKRILLFGDTGKTIDFPFTEPIVWVAENCPIILLGTPNDSLLSIKIGSLKTGKILHEVKSGGLSIADAQTGTYFVKIVATNERRAKKEITVSFDSLQIDDNGWLMYDARGKQLTKTIFRFPIPFNNGIGCGMVGEKWGLWKSDGTAVTPPQYENAVRDSRRGTYAFFQNIGLNNWLVLFDKNGKQLVNTGRYDGISDFYGKYALVKHDNKIGLIDSLGNEIVPLTTFSASQNINFRDSLDLENKEIRKKCISCDTVFQFGHIVVINNKVQNLPIQVFDRISVKNHPDSLELSNELRNIVWNLLLETQVSRWFHTAAEVQINRAFFVKTYQLYNRNIGFKEYKRMRYGIDIEPVLLFDIYADNDRIAFSLLQDSSEYAVYYNFKKEQGVWKRLVTSDFINQTPDNTQRINDLLIQKIRQLKDKDIDCGTSSSFWERGQTRYLTNKNGMIFYFTLKSHKPINSFYFDKTPFEQFFVPIEVSWAELKPFLKQ